MLGVWLVGYCVLGVCGGWAICVVYGWFLSVGCMMGRLLCIRYMCRVGDLCVIYGGFVRVGCMVGRLLCIRYKWSVGDLFDVWVVCECLEYGG